ncbi:MAG: Fe-S-containing hydro-lyase [Bacillota bacterium]
MSKVKIQTPLTLEKVKELKAGDSVLISGTIYTARDAAHARMLASLEKGEKLPFALKNQIIYYVGPAPAKPGQAIGSAGPTTSYRMDPFAPAFIKEGLKGMIGKGLRNQEVIDTMQAEGAVYFAATGGAAALIAQRIKKAEIIAYEDLGAEAVRKLEVEDFPATVVIDAEANNLYQKGDS